MNTEKINAFAFDPCEFPFNIEVSGITDCTDFYLTKRNNSYCFILEYIVKGKGTLVYEGKNYSIGAGDVYFLQKGSNHKYFPDKNQPWKKIWFNIDGILVPSLIVAYGLQNSVVFKEYNNEKIFTELFELTTQSKPKKDIMRDAGYIFHRIMYSLYELENANSIKIGVNAIKNFLDTNLYRSDFSLQEIADSLCISKSHIINTFKKAYNQTPYQYFISQRIQLARSMLLNTQMSISEISDTLNFADQHYFTNVFKNIVGITPTQFKKQNSGDYIERSNKNIKPTSENKPIDQSVKIL